MLSMVCPSNRWSWVEIDQGALRYNTKAFKSLLSRGVQMMCVVKADAYGHGAARCSDIMDKAGADQFAVATVQEGIELRRAGITKPILILNEPPCTSVSALVAYDLMPSVYTCEFALALGEYAASQDKVASYHLAVDTGMTRIGVKWDKVVEFCQTIDFHRGLNRAGMFTHFATADNPDDWDWKRQYKNFQSAVSSLIENQIETGIVHCDNTPGTMLHPEAHHNMCRVGVGLYGMHPAKSTEHVLDLKPVMSVKARITRTDYPEVGEGVGYGLTYRVPKQNIQIATFPIGYADGLSRSLSNKMDVLCHGRRYRQVGRICMDQAMFAVDVNTNRSYMPSGPVSYGDVVTLIGTDGDQTITAEEMAELRGTINYEVTCNFGQRLEKIYI